MAAVNRDDATYNIVVSGGDLAELIGVVGLDLAAAQNIADRAGNALPDVEPGTDDTYELDNAAPVLDSFTRFDPAGQNTEADVLIFLATFSEQVEDVSVDDFSVSAVNIVKGGPNFSTNVSNVERRAGGAVYEITVSGGDSPDLPQAEVGLDLPTTQNITDQAGNALEISDRIVNETFLVDNRIDLSIHKSANVVERCTK